jgi:hypothetical protein
VEARSQVDLPEAVGDTFEVFLNGVQQFPGRDFDQVGRSLVFSSELREEGRLGFWRWLSLFLGVAGTYRRNDSVDIVFTANGRKAVATLVPRQPSDA